MTSEEKFQAAVNIIRSLPKDGPYQPSQDMMLKFYGLYKQAMEGPCNEPKPAFYEVVKGYKWRAWTALGSMSKDKAMEEYVGELMKIIETMSFTENVADFMYLMDPFNEFVEIATKDNNNVSLLKKGFSVRKGPPDHPLTNRNGHNHSVGNSESEDDSTSEESPISSLNPRPSHLSNDNLPKLQNVKLEVKSSNGVHEDTIIDSDSDDEYSEPAETPDSMSTLTANDTVVIDQHSEVDIDDQDSCSQLYAVCTITDLETSLLCDSHVALSPMPDMMMCGGGDAHNHPGGLQMPPGETQGGRGSNPSRNSSPFPVGEHLGTPSRGGGGGTGGGGRGGGSSRGGRGDSADDINAQLVVVLRRLQTDMETLLHRLNALEGIAFSHHHCVCSHSQSASAIPVSVQRERSWWPFPELSPRSTFFLLTWPLILHGGIKLLLFLRSRRRR